MSFIAGFKSDCEHCEDPIEPGQEAVMLDYEKGLVAHLSCSPGSRGPRGNACPDCFLVHAPGQEECE